MNGCRKTAVLLALSSFTLAAGAASAQEAEAAEPDLVIRVYNVMDLVLEVPDHAYHQTQIPEAAFGRGGFGGGFGGGGGGFGGGGNFGGGGQFKVPEGVMPQISGGGGGFGGGGNFGGGGGMERRFGLQKDFDSLIEMLTTSVDPDSWEDVGGPGTIAPFRSALVIAQTAAAHAKIEQLLGELRAANQSARVVTIEAHWIELDSSEIEALLAGADDENSQSVDRDKLRGLLPAAERYRGRISCFDGQTVALIAGRARTVLMSVIPVVGNGETGYQPVIGMPHTGAFLQVTPVVAESEDQLVLDLFSSVTALEPEADPIRFLTAIEGGSSEQGGNLPAAVSIDRVDLVAQQLACTLRVPIGAPVLVGGLTTEAPQGAQAADAAGAQLYLVVQIDVSRP